MASARACSSQATHALEESTGSEKVVGAADITLPRTMCSSFGGTSAVTGADSGVVPALPGRPSSAADASAYAQHPSDETVDADKQISANMLKNGDAEDVGDIEVVEDAAAAATSVDKVAEQEADTIAAIQSIAQKSLAPLYARNGVESMLICWTPQGLRAVMTVGPHANAFAESVSFRAVHYQHDMLHEQPQELQERYDAVVRNTVVHDDLLSALTNGEIQKFVEEAKRSRSYAPPSIPARTAVAATGRDAPRSKRPPKGRSHCASNMNEGLSVLSAAVPVTAEGGMQSSGTTTTAEGEPLTNPVYCDEHNFSCDDYGYDDVLGPSTSGAHAGILSDTVSHAIAGASTLKPLPEFSMEYLAALQPWLSQYPVLIACVLQLSHCLLQWAREPAVHTNTRLQRMLAAVSTVMCSTTWLTDNSNPVVHVIHSELRGSGAARDLAVLTAKWDEKSTNPQPVFDLSGIVHGSDGRQVHFDQMNPICSVPECPQECIASLAAAMLTRRLRDVGTRGRLDDGTTSWMLQVPEEDSGHHLPMMLVFHTSLQDLLDCNVVGNGGLNVNCKHGGSDCTGGVRWTYHLSGIHFVIGTVHTVCCRRPVGAKRRGGMLLLKRIGRSRPAEVACSTQELYQHWSVIRQTREASDGLSMLGIAAGLDSEVTTLGSYDHDASRSNVGAFVVDEASPVEAFVRDMIGHDLQRPAKRSKPVVQGRVMLVFSRV